MKKCLIVMANPSLTSFSNALADEFRAGLANADCIHETINLCQEGFPIQGTDGWLLGSYMDLVAGADGLAFFFPVWCEMPPYPLVAFIQRIFVEGFSFKYEDGQRVLLQEKQVFMASTMGQVKLYNDSYLREAFQYVGLTITDDFQCRNVGPRLTDGMALQYKTQAYNAGYNFFE
jgi:putative NADPH-quinone reductase